jgi:hypothetical protein
MPAAISVFSRIGRTLEQRPELLQQPVPLLGPRSQLHASAGSIGDQPATYCTSSSSHTVATGGGEARGILDALRPTLAIVIAVAVAGALALLALLRLQSVSGRADAVRAEI